MSQGLRQMAKILSLIAVALLLLGAMAWGVCDFLWGRQLRRQLAALRAAGYPTTIAEAQPQPVPQALNAAEIYMPLFGLHLDPQSRRMIEESNVPAGRRGLNRFALAGVTLSEVLAARQTLESAEAQRVLIQLRAGAERPYCMFPIRWEEGMDASLPHLAQFRQAARLICGKAILEARAGRLASALDWLRVAYRLADHVAQEPTVIAQLVAWAIWAIADKAAQQIIGKAPLPPALAKQLYEELGRVDLSGLFARAMRMELAMMLTEMERRARCGAWPRERCCAPDDSLAPSQRVLLILPNRLRVSFFRWEEANLAHDMQRIMQQIQQPYRVAREQLSEAAEAKIGHFFSKLLMPVYSRVWLKRDETIARLHLLQIVLALKAQRAVQGRYPDSLVSLPWRPMSEDPFSGQPFVYRRTGEGFLLYSVGGNLKDDGGRSRRASRNRSEEDDIVWRCNK